MKIPLVLLHGALGSEQDFSFLAEELSHDFDIHKFNFEGHGGRESERPFSIEVFKDNLTDYLHSHSLLPANIFGYSMGGYVALKLSLEHPGHIKKIMTLGTKFHWTVESASIEVSKLNPLKIEEKVPAFAKQLQDQHYPLDWRILLSKTSEMMLHLAKTEAIELKNYSRVKCPVLIGLGSEDNMVTQKESISVVNQIPDSRFHLFEGFKHPIGQVDGKELASVIKSYFGPR